ncbi:hypothetical protein Rsub_06841 [Raphidocelis subcapitata]|uniref:C2 domain-containing protein n=1 Tax=Raphidocelis subcapitata TaxID=307507 RepID=A0A2V0P4K4_9CHLO|nr:hypothetical protein Rsub_06841 [Raphidocelis subcapitata]|eukprot:GBF93842.1 hypothetical protein Rsub_06841 [Raphidocelis subcapitata]
MEPPAADGAAARPPQPPPPPPGFTDRLRAWLLGGAAPEGPLGLAPPWAAWPDYERVENVNALLAALWPHAAPAAEALLRDAAAGALGATGPLQAWGFGVEGLELESLSLGAAPPRLAALKTYKTGSEEQLLLEAPFAWASDAAATLAARLRLPLLRRALRIRVTLRRPQVFAHARVAARPLLEEWPCAGSVSVTLMSPPHFDVELPLRLPAFLAPPGGGGGGGGGGGKGGQPFEVDLLSLPLVRGAFRAAVRIAAQRLALELIPGGAKPPGPAGVLTVRLVRIAGLRSEDLIGQSDPYVVVQARGLMGCSTLVMAAPPAAVVREGRTLRSSTANNTNDPEYDETFVMLVDDPLKQRLRLVVRDDDLGWGDKVLGVAEVPLSEAAFMRAPRTTVPLSLQLKKLSQPPGASPLMLPARVLGLPIAAAISGGRALAGAAARAGGGGGGGGAEPPAGEAEGEAAPLTPRGAASEAGDDYGRGAASDDAASEAASVASDVGGASQAARLRAVRGAGGGRGGGRPVGASASAPAEAGARGGGGSGAQPGGGAPPVQRQQAGEEGPGSAAAQAQAAGAGGRAREEARGTVFLDVTYTPFRRAPRPGDTSPGAAVGACIAGGSVARPGAGGGERAPAPTDKGILTVTLVRATALGGWTGEPDPFVELELFGAGLDSGPTAAPGAGARAFGAKKGAGARGRRGGSTHEHQQVSTTIWNEGNPRWNEKFDFVLVPAGASLLATVKDRTSTFEKIASLRVTDRFAPATTLGRVKVPLAEVAAAGRLRGSWPLQGALEGQLEMALEWIDAGALE